jgi:CheY-like chemotaxis protein
MDGLTLTRRIKSDPALAHIPVIAVTAQAMPGDSEKVTEAGCDGYITKPINFALLEGYLERYLDHTEHS